MAYALGFPKDVTDCVMGMRDWRWEMVRDGGKTPSASCLNWHTDDMWKWPGYRKDSRVVWKWVMWHTEIHIQDDRRIHDMAFQCEPCEP